MNVYDSVGYYVAKTMSQHPPGAVVYFYATATGTDPLTGLADFRWSSR